MISGTKRGNKVGYNNLQIVICKLTANRSGGEGGGGRREEG